MTIFFSPLPGCSLVNYMFGHVDPVGINILPDLESADRDTYFIYYAYGRRPTTPWRFNLYFNVSFCHMFFTLPRGVFWMVAKILSTYLSHRAGIH